MKVAIDAGEWYPCYTLDENPFPGSEYVTAELTEAEIAACKEAMTRFEAWQRRLRALAETGAREVLVPYSEEALVAWGPRRGQA